MTDPNDSVTEKVHNYLQQQSVELDQSTHRQLNNIRQQAVAIAEQQAAEAAETRSWATNTGYAAALVLAVVAGMLIFNTQPTPDISNPSALELVLLNDDFEMLEQDLAFLDWIETELPDRG